MAIACAALAILGYLVIPTSPQPKIDDALGFWQRLDLLGASTGVTGLILINFTWNQAALFMEVIKGDSLLLATAK
ncbi:hypothetical protein N7532_012116 [Penicillium argentinense]|uniref:Uncharacterized protein n=1 Tax=Penicillium argentinense TaxID=1131581 RepID=A0A9W9EJN6_9EURO|nr:uncharacterized protein N7532_012116 [Penicillium argentinense]KAJ5083073.1 hypothetical protein N7532_012116 [Penicillium argentinense]